VPLTVLFLEWVIRSAHLRLRFDHKMIDPKNQPFAVSKTGAEVNQGYDWHIVESLAIISGVSEDQHWPDIVQPGVFSTE